MAHLHSTIDHAADSVCPLCSGKSSRLFEKHSCWIRECSSCTHRFAEIATRVPADHVEQVYSDSYFEGGGAGYSDYLSEATLLTAHGERYGRLLNRYVTPGTVLDVGAAAGFILKGFEHCGWQGMGLEPNAKMAAHAQDKLGLQVAVGTLENSRFNQTFKLITMIQVVAHFYDIHKAFEAAATLTEPGGYWLIETWNKDSLMARFLGQSWHEYSPPSVLHWFSPNNLRCYVQQFGFQEVAQGRPVKKLNGSHAKSLLRYKLDIPYIKQVTDRLINLVPDNLTVPYPNFDLFWGLYQKSIANGAIPLSH